MGDGDIEVTCECGFTSRGRADEVVAETREHGRQVHNMDVSRDQVLAMSRPVAAGA
jgi:predicted small metal-binding protein